LTRWLSGERSRIANSTLRLPITLFAWVYVACRTSIIEYGAEGCSP
jgi:hypothetical protein